MMLVLVAESVPGGQSAFGLVGVWAKSSAQNPPAAMRSSRIRSRCFNVFAMVLFLYLRLNAIVKAERQQFQ